MEELNDLKEIAKDLLVAQLLRWYGYAKSPWGVYCKACGHITKAEDGSRRINLIEAKHDFECFVSVIANRLKTVYKMPSITKKHYGVDYHDYYSKME